MLRSLILRFATIAAALIIGAVLVAVAIVYLSIGLYEAFQNYFSPAAAAFLTAAAAIVLLIIVLLIAKLIGSAARSRTRRRVEKATASAAEIGGLLGRRLSLFAGRESPAILAASLAVGFLMGVSPRLRKVVFRMIGL
jgi:FlaA1/EpsC-like NDP-sugar epimerase